MNGAPNILQRILQHKHEEVLARSSALSQKELMARVVDAPLPRGFTNAIKNTIASGRAAVIAEAKKTSPSRGVIRENFDVRQIVKSYEAGGASCISVLTDEAFFQGNDQYLKQARSVCRLPLIRKDFIIQPYQVVEARVMGADCILLIAAALEDMQMRDLAEFATELQLDILVEVHNEDELQRSLTLNLPLVGINNRNLSTFDVRLQTTIELLEQIPDDRIVVTESGIHTAADVQFMRAHNINAFLIGEAFMREKEPGKRLGALFGQR